MKAMQVKVFVSKEHFSWLSRLALRSNVSVETLAAEMLGSAIDDHRELEGKKVA